METKQTFLDALHERRLQSIENDILLSLCRADLKFSECLDILTNLSDFISNHRTEFKK